MYGQLCSLQGGQRRASDGTLGSAQQRAEQQAGELGSFLAGLNNSLSNSEEPEKGADARAPGSRLSPELMAEVVSVLGRVRESLGGSAQSGGEDGVEKTSGLLQLIDRLQSELRTETPREPPPIPPRRGLLKRLRRPHTTSIARGELSEIRKSLQETRQQLQQQKQQFLADQEMPQTGGEAVAPANANHMARPFVGKLKTGEQQLTASQSPGNAPPLVAAHRPTPAPRAADRVAPCPPPRQGGSRHTRAHTIGSSDEDFAAIRAALESAISPTPAGSRQVAPVSAGGRTDVLEGSTTEQSGDVEALVPQTARVHEARRQFAQSNKAQIHHRGDHLHSNSLSKPGSRSSSQSPRPSLSAVLAKQMTREYLEDSANISRDQVIENRLANHQKANSPVGSSPNVAMSPVVRKEPLKLNYNSTPETLPIEETDRVSGQQEVPTQYTCSIITQETQTSELPPPITETPASSKQVESPTPSSGAKPVWARESRPQQRLSIKPSLIPDQATKPPWVRRKSPEIGSQPPRTQEMQHTKSLPSPAGSDPGLLDFGNSRDQPGLQSATSSQTTAPHETKDTQDQRSSAKPISNYERSPEMVPSTDATSPVRPAGSHLPWSGSGTRSSARASSVSRIASTFNASVDDLQPMSPRFSRLEKTRSLYSDGHSQHTTEATPMQQRQMALQRLQPALSSDEVPGRRIALERSKSEEQIGLRGRSVLGSMKQEQFSRLEQRGRVKPTIQRQQHVGSERPQPDPHSQCTPQSPSQYHRPIPHLKSYPLPPHVQPFSEYQSAQCQQRIRQPENELHHAKYQQQSQVPVPHQMQDTNNATVAPIESNNDTRYLSRSIGLGVRTTNGASIDNMFVPSIDAQLREVNRPVWAQSAGSVHGKVKQQAATLNEAPPPEPFIPPTAIGGPRRHSTDIQVQSPGRSGSLQLLRSNSGSAPATSTDQVQTAAAYSGRSFKPTPRPPSGQMDLRTASLARVQVPSATTQSQSTALPPRSPRPVTALPHDPPADHAPAPVTNSPAQLGSSSSGLQRSRSSDMLRYGVNTKPFEAKLDAASAKAQQKRLQDFFQEREAEREDEKLARSFEDLLDDLDEDDLAAVSPQGDGGKSDWPVQMASSPVMHALAKSATVGDLRSGRSSGMFAPPLQRQLQTGTGSSMPTGGRASSK